VKSKTILSILSIILLGSLSTISTVYADSVTINDQASCEDIPDAVWSTSPDTCTITTPQTIASGETWTIENVELVINSELTMETDSTINGGNITINSSSDINIDGTLDAYTITINADTVTINGTINVDDLFIDASGDIDINDLNAASGDAPNVGLSASGSINVSASGTVTVSSSDNSGNTLNPTSGSNGNIAIGSTLSTGSVTFGSTLSTGSVTLDNSNSLIVSAGPLLVGTIAPIYGGSISLTASTINTSNGQGSGCSGDCTPPTIGVDRTGDRKVSDGFSYNYNTVDVDYFHTEFPLITTQVGEQNTVTTKVYENTGPNNLSLVQFGIGIPEIGSPLNDAEVIVEVWLESGGINVEEIVITDPLNLVDNDSVSASTSLTHCTTGDAENNCVEMTLHYTYREAPIYNVMLVQPMDKSRHTESTYLNDGIAVQGNSLNPPKTERALAGQSGIIQMMTQTDRKNNLWVDEYGYMWTQNQYDTWLQITRPEIQRHQDEVSNVMTRNNSNFVALVNYEIDKATKVFDGTVLQKETPDSFANAFPDTIGNKSDDSEVQERMMMEESKAQQTLEEMDRQTHRIHLVVD